MNDTVVGLKRLLRSEVTQDGGVKLEHHHSGGRFQIRVIRAKMRSC